MATVTLGTAIDMRNVGWNEAARETDRRDRLRASFGRASGGTSTGIAGSRAALLPPAVCLETQNRILSVKDRSRAWLRWTVLKQIVPTAAFGAVDTFKNMVVGFQGPVAGILGEIDSLDRMFKADGADRGPLAVKRYAKIIVSCVYFAFARAIRSLAQAFGRSMPGAMLVLYYHAVPSSKRAGFVRHMAILARDAHVVPADWCDGTDPARPTVAITFDDAFTSVVDNALPELARRGFPCTIFVPSGVLGRNPDWAMEGNAERTEVVVDAARLTELRGPLVAIGAHSVSHPRLTRIAPERARAEIGGSRAALARLIGAPVTLFAFPYGDYDASVVEICRQEGFKHVFTIEPEPVDPGAGSLIRGRVYVDPDDGNLEFVLKMSGAYAWMPLASALKRRLRSVRGRALKIVGPTEE
jgi:peptidoglycan/xylan/chitin deacetylase (PgdA/CDA1 family)